MEWQPRRWEPPQEGVGKRYGQRRDKKVNMAGVGSLSRRLMALERARVLGRKPPDLRAYALEQAAKRWAEERARRK